MPQYLEFWGSEISRKRCSKVDKLGVVMKKQNRSLFGKSKSIFQSVASKLRTLKLESLEGRRLMASDFALQHHNYLIPEDVNLDFVVSPIDALQVINHLNNLGPLSFNSEGEATNGQAASYLDVNGDNEVSPIDALLVINHLNGEGETDPLITYSLSVTDVNGNPISQVAIGSTFRVNTLVRDSRTMGATGIFSAYLDLDVSDLTKLQYPVNQSQTFFQGIRFNSEFGNGRRGSAGVVPSVEEFNEVGAFMTNTVPLANRDPAVDPNTEFRLFFVDFVALTTGSVTFQGNGPDSNGSDNLLFGSSINIPNTMINFGNPVSINIVSDPNAPIANNDTVSTPEDTALTLTTSQLTANDSSPAGQALTVTAIAAIPGTTGTKGTVSGFTYTPPLNFVGSDLVTYTVRDVSGRTATATVTINVTQVNDPPVAVADTATVTGDTPDNLIEVLTNDNGGPANESQTLTITALGTPSNGTVTRTTNNTAVLYTPAPGFAGTDTFTYTIQDSGGATATATVTVTVEPGVRPFARRDTATIAEDATTGVTINVLANDLPNAGANVTLLSFTNPAQGTVTLDNNGTVANLTDDRLVYLPSANFNGTDTFTYTINDTSVGAANSTATVTVTVTDVNDPVILANDTVAGTEDLPVTIPITTLLNNDSPGVLETTSQQLSITSVSTTSGTVAIVGANVVYTPALNANGAQTFTYVATDNGTPATQGTATVTVNLTAVNDAPVANTDTASTNEDTALTLALSTLLTNDAPGGGADEAAQQLTITGVSSTNTAGGTVAISGTNVVYTPAANFNGSYVFNYTVSDNGSPAATSTGTVTVTVNPINDAPTAGADTANGFKGQAIQIPVATLLANDNAGPANESGQTLSITGVSGAVNGTVSLNSTTGIVTFTPAANFTGNASFQYTVQDSGPTGGTNVNSALGTVTVNVANFVPTTIAGTVWVDDHVNGTIEAAELKLAGVTITLTGVALGETIPTRTYTTLANGSYQFTNLAPGRYVVKFSTPAFMEDGADVAGPLGDADTVANQFTINVAEPGGANASGYNFAVNGLASGYRRDLGDLLASNFRNNPTLLNSGVYAAVGADNSLQWFAGANGFRDVLFGEVVLSNNDTLATFTIVDSSRRVFSTLISDDRFVVINDPATGGKIVRIVGGLSSFNFQQVNLASPPVDFPGRKYLAAIDAIFDQEGW